MFLMTGDYELDQESARALVDAGYMPLSEYLELCKRNGWQPKVPDGKPDEPKRRAHPEHQGDMHTA
jgi:hypothetical protein